MLTNPDNWYPHFSVEGRIASGSGTVYLEGQRIGAPGWQARWIRADAAIWNSGSDTRITSAAGTTQHSASAFAVLAAGNGVWAGWNEQGVFLNGQALDAAGDQPWISREGQIVYKTDRQSSTHAIVYNHQQVAPRGHNVNPRCEGGVVVWSEHQSQYVLATRGWRGHGIEDLRVIPESEIESVPIATPDGPFVLTSTDWGFFIRPWGLKNGWMYQGDCFTPDAICLDRIIYVTGWSGTQGRALLLKFPLHLARAPIRSPRTDPAPGPQPDPTPTNPVPQPPAVSLPDHFPVVQAIDAAHPQLLQRNTRTTVAEFYWRAARALHQRDPEWGMLRRDEDDDHHIVEGVRVSIDCVAHRSAKRIVDFLQSAGDGPGTGRLTWSVSARPLDPQRWVQPPPFREIVDLPGGGGGGGGGDTAGEDDQAVAELTELAASLRSTVDLLQRRCADLEARAVRYGARTALRTQAGHVVCAVQGGGGGVHAEPLTVGPWETFKIDQP